MENPEKNIEETLIIAYLNGDELDDIQKNSIENWLQNEVNQEEAKRIYQAWELSSLTSNKFVDTKEGLKQLQKRLGNSDEKSAKSRSINWRVTGIAASLLIATALIFFLTVKKESNHDIELSSTNSKTDFILPDSTQISLHSNTYLRYADDVFKKDSRLRSVNLSGEAYFEVTHDQYRPFKIITKDAEIVVLGTKFFVKSVNDEPTSVMVTEGRVQVTSLITKEKYIIEAKKEVTLYTATTTAPDKLNENKLYWQTGMFKFNNDSLSVVFNTLSKEFGVTIQATNKKVLNCKLTATFKKQSLKEIIRVIEATHELTSRKEKDTILIEGNGCN